ncbi:DUF3159 domain-containing protein [Pseudonocardia sp. RS11V-5]|uniref:DUF3159 domain-containing protein n=1 Tax=Pseudonocardia terrae TaxID=2905831 RepID=UPI001E4DACA8|nr:DUF3159 domain-containing protein [Pseudonocardia terrae]MCE3553891.1 DUF3159 domain-containing protein [Pseudonocardia terrae]
MTPGPEGDQPTTRIPRVAGEPADHDSATGPIPRVPVEETARGAAGETDGDPDGDPDDDPAESERRPTLLEQMGGIPGIIASTVPVAVFVVANVLFSLKPALIAAVVAGVLVALFRIARRQPLQPAISGLFGVAVCAFIAYRTGEARGFYLPGLLYSAALGLAFLVSIVVRWPLAGVIWHAVNGHGQDWRRNPRMLRAYGWASALWALVFAARLVVQGWLYNADEETWLGIARLGMGYPLLGLAIVGTVVAVRRAERTPAPS